MIHDHSRGEEGEQERTGAVTLRLSGKRTWEL